MSAHGRELRTIRASLKANQSEIARLVGTSKSTIGNLEAGRPTESPELAAAILDKLGVVVPVVGRGRPPGCPNSKPRKGDTMARISDQLDEIITLLRKAVSLAG